MPIDTPGSPFSTLARVVRLMKARSAISAMGIRRRRRAAERSMPSFCRARRTPRGSACWDREDFMNEKAGDRAYMGQFMNLYGDVNGDLRQVVQLLSTPLGELPDPPPGAGVQETFLDHHPARPMDVLWPALHPVGQPFVVDFAQEPAS